MGGGGRRSWSNRDAKRGRYINAIRLVNGFIGILHYFVAH